MVRSGGAAAFLAAVVLVGAGVSPVRAVTVEDCERDMTPCRRKYRGPGRLPRSAKEVQECQVEVPIFISPEVARMLHTTDGNHLVTHEGGGQKEQRLWMCSVLKRDVFDKGVPGAVVELGVFKGATSTLIAHTIRSYTDQPREHHLYDSFEGFPDPTRGDLTHGHVTKSAFKGNVRSAQTDVILNFKAAGLPPPSAMHKGFFGNIPDDEYPTPIAFAFFDGDMYASIRDSFAKVWDKMAHGGVVFIHDYQADVEETKWPGPKRAIDEFFADRPERVEQCWTNIAKIVKQTPLGAYKSGQAPGAPTTEDEA